jgi:hypothetical protein
MEAASSVTMPDWLARHGGELRVSADGRSYLVYFAGDMQYVVVPLPAKGEFGCRVTQTINGRRLDSGAAYATFADAVRGGLEDLRKTLGW